MQPRPQHKEETFPRHIRLTTPRPVLVESSSNKRDVDPSSLTTNTPVLANPHELPHNSDCDSIELDEKRTNVYGAQLATVDREATTSYHYSDTQSGDDDNEDDAENCEVTPRLTVVKNNQPKSGSSSETASPSGVVDSLSNSSENATIDSCRQDLVASNSSKPTFQHHSLSQSQSQSHRRSSIKSEHQNPQHRLQAEPHLKPVAPARAQDTLHRAYRTLALASSGSDSALNRWALSPLRPHTGWRGRANRKQQQHHHQQQYKKRKQGLLGRSISTSSIFAYYTKRFAKEKLFLAIQTFKAWYHQQLTYHHLSNRMEYNRQLFERWYKSKGQPLSLRALDHFDQVVIWIADERDAIQKKTFTKWINKYLNRRGGQVQDLFQDLRDGQDLISLLEMLSGQPLPRERGRMRVHQLQNIQIALNYIKLRKVKLVNIRPEDIVDGNQKLTLGLIWTIILHFQLEDNSNFREILLRWAQKTTEGYPGCKVVDLTKSFHDGLAYNAIIHRNRPDLLDYRGCKNKTSRENLNQAFTVAECDLGVTRLLDPDDVPKADEKSMITYLAQLYELFPDPPERNPLLDAEKIRRIEEYKELASRLLRWIKDSTNKLEDRRFPKTIPELKALLDENERFRTEEIPPKQHDKKRLASVANDIYKMAQDVGVKINNDLHMENIDYHWDRMMNAHRARTQAINDEIQRAERLKALLEKLLQDIKRTNEKMDGIERDINEEERRIGRSDLDSLKNTEQFSPQKLQAISEDLANVGIKIDGIKRLAEDFIKEAGRTNPDSIMVREKVAELDGRYKKLLSKLAHLHDEFDRAIRRLRQLEDEAGKAKRQREAEAKLRLKLDAMKRELDELEHRIDNMAPVAKDLATLEKQLAEMRQFDQDLNKAKQNLNDLISLAEDMIREDLIADPITLRANLSSLKDQLARIEDKAARRLREFENAYKLAENQKATEAQINIRLDAIKKELIELERRLDNMAPVGKDIATLQKQLAEMQDFNADLDRTRTKLHDLVDFAEDKIREGLVINPANLRNNLKALKDHLTRIEDKANKRMKAIQDGLNKAEAQRSAETKFRLLLDAMKRELEEKERQLDNMAPIAKEPGSLQQQLAEINDFIQNLATTKRNLNDLVKSGEELIRDDMIVDPEALRAGLKELKEHFARIENKANKRLRDIQDAMSRVAASDAIQELAQWLERAKKVLINEENVHGDLDTVNALIEQHKSFEEELANRQPTMNEVKRMEKELSNTSPQNGAIIRDEMSSLINQWREIEKLIRDKSGKLDEALKSAEQMHDWVHKLLEWLADAELKLRFAGSMPEDDKLTKLELEEHEKFMRKLDSQGQNKDQTLKLARDILNKCHPDAEPVIKHWINIIQARWDEIEAWAKQRGQRLADHLRSLLDILELVEELIGWLSKHEGRLLAEESDSLPENVHQLDAMIDQHHAFMDELRKRETNVDRVVKIFAAKSQTLTSKTILTTTTTKPREPTPNSKSNASFGSSGRLSGGARSVTPTRTSYATYKDEYPDVKHNRARIMLEKWRAVWQLALDKMQRLKDRVEHLREIERLENFDFDEWRRRFLTWVNAKKSRVMDFYRSIDDDNDGRIPIDAFINGVLRSKFETSRVEMERVAEIFDKNNDGTVDNKEYLDSLRPDKPITDDELIQDEVQRQVSKCTCPQRYKVYHVGEGRYRFGESQKLRLVRILRSTVMVRVGGGWEPLISFLQKNDPCRAKGRTNVELREQFILPEGASQAMAAFRSRMSKDPGSMPALGPITKIREKTDRSMPMTGSRYGSPSDYYSETESTPKTRSRIGRLTPASTSSRPASRPTSRHGSDLYTLDQSASKSSDNLH